MLRAQAPWYPAPLTNFKVNALDVLAADLNSDTVTDLVAAGGDQIAVALGLGQGQFTVPAIVSQINDPISLVDVNADGKLDIVGCAGFDVSVALGNGQGGFGPELRSPTGHLERAVSVADCDGDGTPDAVAAHVFGGASAFTVVKGVGNGVFSSAVHIPAGGWKAGELRLADVDLDAKPEIVATLVDPATGVVQFGFLHNTGTSFAAPTVVPVPAHTLTRFALGDVTGDGRVDAVILTQDPTASAPDGAVWLLTGNASLGFAAPVLLATASGLRDVEATDADRDGRFDVVYSHADVGVPVEVVVLRAQGGGSFAPAVRTPTGVPVVRFTVADLNADGRPDLAFVSNESSANPVGLLTGRGDGSFSGVRALPLRTDVRAVAVANVVGNALDDLIYADLIGQSVNVQENFGGATFAPPTRYSVPGRPISIEMGDLDGDARSDLTVELLAANGDHVVTSLLARAGGFASTGSQFQTTPADSTVFVLDDVDGDHVPDVIVPHDGSVEFALGRGDGTFQPPSVQSLPCRFFAIAAGDLDQDGDIDLAMPTLGQYQLLFAWNDGHGDFSSQSYAPTTAFGPVRIVDIDGDGDQDVLCSSLDNMVLVRNDGASGFIALQSAQVKAIGPNTQWVVLDVDGDQQLDVAFNRPFEAYVARGHGDGTFDLPRRHALGTYPLGLATGDLDGNGSPDLVAPNGANSPPITFLLHR